MTYTTTSEAETKTIAKKILKKHMGFLETGTLVFLLKGDLGTGKTIFTKGLGEALEIDEPITSASFVLEKEYQGAAHKLIHLDFWRFESLDEVVKMELQRHFESGNVVVIEWANIGDSVLEEVLENEDVKVVKVGFEDVNKNTREIDILD